MSSKNKLLQSPNLVKVLNLDKVFKKLNTHNILFFEKHPI